ncbi:MAG: YceI family protein [Fimbriimonadaceae bacterium]|nr:YceI family protein [Fimbriimonadaceae bacterium]
MRSVTLWAALVTVAMAALAADRMVFLADDPARRDVITIISDAPLEYMVTRSQQVTGEVQVDPENLLRDPVARFEVPVDSLSTGLPLRDEHMRGEAWLNARAHPAVRFELKKIKSPAQPTALLTGETVELDVVGTLELRGVKVDLPVTLSVTRLPNNADTASRLPGEVIRVIARFDLLRSDFGLQLPPPAVKKIANRQQVEVRLFCSTEKPKLPG